MTLDDEIWPELQGGYRGKYDASVRLKQLEQTNDTQVIEEIGLEFWNELHHQGDVGAASYLALPQIVRICKQKNIFDWNLLGLCMVIEQRRLLGNNPPLPAGYESYYSSGLEELYQYSKENLETKTLDEITYILVLAALATCKGHTKLGKAIMDLSSKDILDEFVE